MKRAWWLVLASCAAAACVASTGSTRGGDGGTEVTLDGLKSRTPATWKKQNPANKFRAYQFTVPKVGDDKDDAELVVFYFGAGGGGGIKDNLERWKGMFRAPEGKTIDELSKVQEFKVGAVPVTYLDVRGIYQHKFPPFDPNAKVTPRPDYRRLGVIFQSKEGPYFITLTGPNRTVEQARKGFDDWIKGFK
ncbi:MAG: hypothetical protein IT429_11180 [Gemmataceae bacterium]|nr:hypothetical protein [Gemmataceae bacterium]